MYAHSIIQSKFSAIQSKIDLRPKTFQFTLKLHSIPEIDFYNKHLYSLIEGNYIPGKPKSWKFSRPLRQDELNFIENERIICQNYFLYAATRYGFVRSTVSDKPVDRFYPWKSQKIVVDLWAEAEAQFHAIMTLYLKARQLGISLINDLNIAWRMQYNSHQKAYIGSSDPDKTKEMVSVMQFYWDMQPPWMICGYEITRSKEEYAKLENNSYIVLQHGTAKSGMGRGANPNLVHCSEIPDWQNPSEDIDASLINAIHPNLDTFLSLESTAKGKTGKGKWWYDKWKFAKRNYPKSLLRPVFLPYFIGEDIYPTKTFERQFIPKNISKYKFKEDTLLHAKKCTEYANDTPYLRKYLGRGWKLPFRQMYWWEFTRQEYLEQDKLYKFLEEMPANDDEAYQRSGRGLFTAEQLQFLRLHSKPLADYHGKPAVFGVVGDGIELENEPSMDEIDTSRPLITINCDWDSNNKRKYRLIPLIHDTEFWENRLFIYEFPFLNKKFDIEYGLGVDGGGGVYQNNSVIEVVKKGTLTYPSEQVAEFASPNLTSPELTPFCLAIGTYFSLNNQNYVNQAKQVVEINFGGYELQRQLQKAGWSQFHVWRGAYDNLRQTSSRSIGWETNRRTRSMLVTQVISQIKGGFFKINSPFFIEELGNLEKTEDSEKIEAKGSNCDDRFIGGGIVFFSLHDQELYLMGSGDQEIMQMFKSHSNNTKEEYIPQLRLAEAIEENEKMSIQGDIEGYLISASLPIIIDREEEELINNEIKYKKAIWG